MYGVQSVVGDVVQYDNRTITVSDGVRSSIYSGDFQYDIFGNVFGTLTGYSERYNGALIVEAFNFRADATLAQQAINSGNPNALIEYVMVGNDFVSGSPDADKIAGFGGNDVLNGRQGNDIIYGDDGRDVVNGGGGDDILLGGWGVDVVVGGTGDDQMYGDADRDKLRGRFGEDTVNGGSGDDELLGNQGDDALFGNAGADFLIGGLGNDTINGGAGNDLIQYRTADEAHGDVLVNFMSGSDLIVLRRFDANEALAGKQGFEFIGGRDFSGAGGELRAVVVGRDTVVSGDTSGDGLANFTFTVSDTGSLSESDFLL